MSASGAYSIYHDASEKGQILRDLHYLSSTSEDADNYRYTVKQRIIQKAKELLNEKSIHGALGEKQAEIFSILENSGMGKYYLEKAEKMIAEEKAKASCVPNPS